MEYPQETEFALSVLLQETLPREKQGSDTEDDYTFIKASLVCYLKCLCVNDADGSPGNKSDYCKQQPLNADVSFINYMFASSFVYMYRQRHHFCEQHL